MAAPRKSAESDKAIEESQEMTCCSIPPPLTDLSLLSPYPWSPTDLPWSPSCLSQSATDVPRSPPLPFSQSPPWHILPSNQSIEIPQFQQHEDLVFNEIISLLCLQLQNMQLMPQTLHEVSPQQLPDLLAQLLAQQLMPQLPPQQFPWLRQLPQLEKLEFLLHLDLLLQVQHQLLELPLVQLPLLLYLQFMLQQAPMQLELLLWQLALHVPLPLLPLLPLMPDLPQHLQPQQLQQRLQQQQQQEPQLLLRLPQLQYRQPQQQLRLPQLQMRQLLQRPQLQLHRKSWPTFLNMCKNMIEHINWGLFRNPTLPPIIKTKLYEGVWRRQDGEWVAKIRHHRKWVNIGPFNTAEEAAIAHDRAVYMLRGRLAQINFPELVGVSHNFLDKNRAEPTAATIMEILSPPTQQDEDYVLWWSKRTRNDEIEAIGIEGEETRENEMNSGLGKGKRKVMTTGEESKTKKSGVRIVIPLEDIQQRKEMSIMDAAMDLKVSKSTLKRACREYGIPRWPPRENNKLISNSLPTKTPMNLGQEKIPQPSSHTLPPSNQALPIVNIDSVIVKARHENGITIKFRLSSPWRRVELNQQVEKRLELEAETYYVQYKDEDNDLILISGDDNLEECISNSRLIGANSIEVFLKPRQPI